MPFGRTVVARRWPRADSNQKFLINPIEIFRLRSYEAAALTDASAAGTGELSLGEEGAKDLQNKRLNLTKTSPLSFTRRILSFLTPSGFGL